MSECKTLPAKGGNCLEEQIPIVKISPLATPKKTERGKEKHGVIIPS